MLLASWGPGMEALMDVGVDLLALQSEVADFPV